MTNFTRIPEKSAEVLRDFLFSSNEIGPNMKGRCASICYMIFQMVNQECDFYIYDGNICSLGNFHNQQRRRIENQPNGTYTIQYIKNSFSNKRLHLGSHSLHIPSTLSATMWAEFCSHCKGQV